MDAMHAISPWMALGPRASISPALIEATAEAWGLGAVDGIGASSDMGGTYNLNLRLQTDRGDVVMRVYRPWVGPGRLAAVQALRTALRGEGIPTLTPLRRRDGTTTLAVGDRLIEVEPWVSSDGGADSWDRYQAAAVHLGQLHCAFRSVRLPVPFVPAPISNVLTDQTFHGWLARSRLAVGAAPPSVARTEALRACDDAYRLRQLIGTASPPRPHHIQLTHGDFGHENIRFFGPTPVALLDFDFADVRDRLTDVAYLAYWMFEYLQWDVPAPLRDWDQVAGLVQGYGTEADSPLTADELAALPLAMATIPLSWVAEAWLLTDPVVAIGYVTRQLEIATWLIEHRHALATRWSDGWRATG